MGNNKWEFKQHSYQIGNTGDYDGYNEVTNGIISLGTKDDDEETVEVLQALVGHLNAWDINFFDCKADELSIDNHLLKEENKELQAKCDRYEKALEAIQYLEHADIDTMKALVLVSEIVDKALSSVEEEINPTPTEPEVKGAVWVKGAPNERKQHFAKVPAWIEDDVIYEAIIWPIDGTDHWWAIGNGFQFTLHVDSIIAWLNESAGEKEVKDGRK